MTSILSYKFDILYSNHFVNLLDQADPEQHAGSKHTLTLISAAE